MCGGNYFPQALQVERALVLCRAIHLIPNYSQTQTGDERILKEYLLASITLMLNIQKTKIRVNKERKKNLPMLFVFSLYLIVFIATSMVYPAFAATQTYMNSFSGANEVPPVSTDISGNFKMVFDTENPSWAWTDVWVAGGKGITAAHLHCGAAGESGPAIVTLFARQQGIDMDGNLASTTIDNADIIGGGTCVPPIVTVSDLISAAQSGKIYANVHSLAYPNGFMRTQVNASTTFASTTATSTTTTSATSTATTTLTTTATTATTTGSANATSTAAVTATTTPVTSMGGSPVSTAVATTTATTGAATSTAQNFAELSSQMGVIFGNLSTLLGQLQSMLSQLSMMLGSQ